MICYVRFMHVCINFARVCSPPTFLWRPHTSFIGLGLHLCQQHTSYWLSEIPLSSTVLNVAARLVIRPLFAIIYNGPISSLDRSDLLIPYALYTTSIAQLQANTIKRTQIM